MGNIFPRQPRFDFFDMMHDKPDWSDASILDIGGNRGNLLEDGLELKRFTAEQYTSLDVDQEALNFGKQQHSTANWVHHDAFNNVYNIQGQEELVYPFDDNTFDLICSYSVYSHTTFKQFVFDLIEMFRICKPNGSIALTLVDTPASQFFTQKRVIDLDRLRIPITFEKISKFNIVDYMYFVDHDLLVDEIYSKSKMDFLVTIYNLKWLGMFLNKLNITHKFKFPPQHHVQRTLVIKKAQAETTVEELKNFYKNEEFLVDIL
jgi:SAM-dependent methyltransferase